MEREVLCISLQTYKGVDMAEVTGMAKAIYTDKEKSKMTPARREISNLTREEWCARWDATVSRIQAIHELDYIALKKRREANGL